MKHNISYHLEKDRFILYIEVTNFSGEERRFYFNNDTGSLARNGIRLYDKKDQEIEVYERAFMSPAYNSEKVSMNILPVNETMRFELPGRVLEEDGDLVLSFKGISFRIPGDEKFYITFEYSRIVSNRLEVMVGWK
ncbi:hypothetical protein CLU96_3537 [Chryseobacterium sp. 52]|uniref:hypothetical protein n=1 Tax=Chryseobacterium sp. 52 TaxID=2035213 RepID=UPI000C39F657|nr:hypothetical protein [Chryseobacterium sp. 52]PIF46499.1 hypothetical protein CLU96_3537 [Chryseobacterium sp. 52]